MTIVQFFFNEWFHFAVKHKGSCKMIKTAPGIGGLNSWLKVEMKIPFRNSQIVFTAREASSLKIIYDFNKNINLEFLIYHEDYMDKISKLFGQKEVEINNSEFDRIYFIKSDHETFVKKIFNSEVTGYLIKRERCIANFKLETIKYNSVLELNTPFDETDIDALEKTLSFIKNVLTNIYEFSNASIES